MEVKFCPLFSGSAGNAVYVGAGGTHLLVDCGMSGKRVQEALLGIGVDPARISALLVTHEHSDHVAGVGVLARRFGIPVYANADTWRAMSGTLGAVPPAQRREFITGQDFFVEAIGIEPYAIPHDAADPVGYCFYMGEKKISIATDLGHTKPEILDRIAESDILLLEANHDVDMLKRCDRYTASLKKRIQGQKGHLSNEQCADAIAALTGRGVNTVVLGHLSDQSNTPRLAYEFVSEQLRDRHDIVVGRELSLSLAWRDRPGDILSIR